MSKIKNRWLVEIAANFNMTVNNFANHMGYSRQALYQATDGVTKLGRRRLAVSRYMLELENQKILEAEKA